MNLTHLKGSHVCDKSMSSINEKHQIGKIMKLIDLNKDVVNFDMSFQVVSEGGEEFEICILDQATLDEGNIDYRKVQGGLTGNIRNDKNVYQSHMMALRADKPCNVTVSTNFQTLPETPMPPPVAAPKPVKVSQIPWKMILIGLIVIVGVGMMIYFYVYGNAVKVIGGAETSSVPMLDTAEVFSRLRNLPLR
jgi:hypothetical protein